MMAIDSSKNPSLFDDFQNEINNEELLQCDISIDGKSFGEMFGSNEKDSITNHYTNLNDCNDCDDMIKAFDDAFDTIYGDNEVNFFQVQQVSEELQTNCLRLINNMIKNRKDSKIEAEQLQFKYNLLEKESITTINNLQHQITELNLQLKQQSTFSSVIGSSFGFYLWKATQIPAVVDMVLQENKITNTTRLMSCVLSSFIETYNNKMPSIKTHETKFVLNILGIVANLTVTKAGCRFFSQINDGINVVNLIVSLVLCTPPSLENNLKRVAYAALYNVSIQFNGHLLMENNKLIETLHNDIIVIPGQDANDTLLYALKLLHSLTKNINERMYTILKNEINLKRILKLTKNSQTELTARKIYENISNASEKYNDKF